MTTIQSPQPDPHYVTQADLEAFEGRMINRFAKLESQTAHSLLVTALTIIGVNLTVVGVSAAALYSIVSTQTAVLTAILGKLP